MTLFNQSRTKTATFRKANFIFVDSSIKGGIKFAEYEYPNNNRRDLEQLGGMLKKITISGLIDCNVNYKKRDKLQKIFDEPKAGLLSLPFYKKMHGYITEYSFNDNNNAVGQTGFTCEFVEVSKDKKNKKTGKGVLANLKSKILGKYEEQFDKAWNYASKTITEAKKKYNEYKEVFDSAVETTKNIANKINQVASSVAGAGDSLGDAASAINEIINSANKLVNSPKALFSNFKVAFDNLGVAYNSSKDLFKVCRNLFDINEKDREQIGNSIVSQDIRNNQNLINQAVRINALTLAYQTAVDIDYSNTQEINDVIASLENGFSLIDLSIDREIIDLLHSLRYNAINELNQLRLSVPNVVEYEVKNPTPLINIIFNLYGNDDNKDTIIAINNFQDTSSIIGNIKVLKYVD